MNEQTDQQRQRIRIQQLAQQINELSEQLTELLIEERNQGQQQHPAAAEREPNQFLEGDRVRIRNNYRGLRGATGTVIHLTPQQVSIRLDSNNRVVNRKRTNVSLIVD